MFGVFLATSLLAVAGAFAQVTVEVVLDQQQFLPGEALPIAVRIVNHSGQTLKLGTDDEWLNVAVQGRAGSVVQRLGDLPVRGEFTLESSQRATRRLDLAPYFNVSRQGRYLIQATVKVAQWDKSFASDPVPFDVITGARLWEREFGVPQSDTNSAPEVRKYILQEANYLKKDLRLYVRLTDVSETRIYRVLPIGPMVSFGKPEPQLDRQSNLHILYQRGRTSCSYIVVNPDGDILIRQTYEVANSRPRLKYDEQGNILVAGGVRRYAQDDFPPRETLPPTKDSLPPSNPVAGTNDVKAAKP